jgi:hypothetical protein
MNPKINTAHHGKRKNDITRRIMNRNRRITINTRTEFSGTIYARLKTQSQ